MHKKGAAAVASAAQRTAATHNKHERGAAIKAHLTVAEYAVPSLVAW